MTRRRIIWFLLLPVLLLAVTWTVYGEVYAFRMTRLLEEVRSAEETLPFEGDQLIRFSSGKGEEREVVFRIWNDPPDGHRREFKEVRRNGEKMERGSRSHGDRPPKEGKSGGPGGRRPDSHRGGPRNFEGMAARAIEHLTRMLQGDPDRRLIMRFHDLGLLLKNYDVRFEATEQVAGREADRLRVHPRHPDRSGYRLWTDRETRFPLGFSVLDPEGRPQFQTRFDRIRFHPEFSEETAPGSERHPRSFPDMPVERREESLREAAGRVDFPVWEVVRLPEGVEAIRTESISATLPLSRPGLRPPASDEGEEKPTPAPSEFSFELLHAFYTDGAAHVSFLQTDAEHLIWKMLKPVLEKKEEKAEQEAPKTAAGKLRVYRLFRHGRGAMIAEREGTLIIVAGNLPERELLEMMTNMRRVP